MAAGVTTAVPVILKDRKKFACLLFRFTGMAWRSDWLAEVSDFSRWGKLIVPVQTEEMAALKIKRNVCCRL